MKKLLCMAGLLFANVSHAIDPNTVLINQVDPTGSYQMTRFLSPPAEDSYLHYDVATNTFRWGYLTSVQMSASQITNATAIGKDLITVPTAPSARSIIGCGTSNFSGIYSDLTGKPANLSDFTNNQGFINSTVLSSYATISALTTGLSGKFNYPSCLSSQYLRGDGSCATFPTIPAVQINSDWSATSGVSQILNKPVKYSGPTSASGIYSVTYGAAYSVKPHVIFSVEGGTNKDSALITSTTASGFSILVERRTDVVGVLPTYAPVSGLTVNVTVTQ